MNATPLSFLAVAFVCATLGVYMAVSSRGEARLERANGDLIAGRSADVLAELDGLSGEAGSRANALRAYAYLDRRRPGLARRAFQAAVRHDPNNWVLQRDYARVLLRLGDRAKARARISRAKALNPRMAVPPGFVGAR